MKPADAVCDKETEKLGIGVRVGGWNVEPVETETVEATAGPSDHDALAKRSQRADDRCGGIDSDVICEYQPGGRIDFSRHGWPLHCCWLAPDDGSSGRNRVVIAEGNYVPEAGVE